jgi:hypothetical protein
MQYIPKVKTVKVVSGISSGMIEGKLCPSGEFSPGKLPSGGFNPVWNFKNNEPNDYFTRKQSPTSGGSKKS